jgi:hypothetical protein
MPFTPEEDMRSLIVDNIFDELKQLFRNNALFQFEEVPYVSGVTDLVIANVSDKYLVRRIENLGLKKSILNDTFLQLYVLLRREKTIKIKNLKKTHNSPATLKAIKWLDNNGFINHKGDTITLTKSFKKHITDTYAFEFKISDWRQALKQAFGAKSYSNIQFVIIDDDFIKPAIKNKKLFSSF